VLQPRQAVHGDGTLREIAFEKRALSRWMRGSGIASDRGVAPGGLGVGPTEEGIDCIERRDGTDRVVFAEGERSRQDT
jgi:hypothetical protein